MADNLPPLAPRELRTRVAVPLAPPVLKPSLIPYDVLQALEREAREPKGDAYEGEPTTAPQPVGDDVALLSTSAADPEVAIFALSQVAMFKELPVSSLEAMAGDAEMLEVPEGEFLFNEGDDASCFYVVVDGTLEILRQKDGREVALRHMGCGEAIGLFGLFSAQLRAASARAIGDCSVIQVSGERLQALLERDDALNDKLLDFYRERLLEGFMANKLFADIDSIARARLIGRFAHRELEANSTLLNPGEVANLLAVVTHGTLMLEDRARPGGKPKLYEVTPGQFLVVTSALTGVPSRLRVFTSGGASVALLGQKDLNELIKDYPAMRAMPARLPAVARPLDTNVFCGTTGVPGL